MLTLTQLVIAIKCFGVSVSYLIICKVSCLQLDALSMTETHPQTLLPQVCVTFASIVKNPLPEDSILLSQNFWLVVIMIFIVPLSFLKTLDALRFTSQIALGTVV